MLLENKTAIVTGGARGIGRAICELFSSEGANVVIADSNYKESEKLSKKIRGKSNRECLAIKTDVSVEKEVTNLVNSVLENFETIDILVNNAGILLHKLIIEIREEEWDNVINNNLKGVFLCSKHVAKTMIKNHSGKIINISSLSAINAVKEEGAYSASKAGILGLARVLALELGEYGINVNSICPGFTKTEMTSKAWLVEPGALDEWKQKTALKKIGKPLDQARVALFLASHLSDHMTGVAINVSAGEVIS